MQIDTHMGNAFLVDLTWLQNIHQEPLSGSDLIFFPQAAMASHHLPNCISPSNLLAIHNLCYQVSKSNSEFEWGCHVSNNNQFVQEFPGHYYCLLQAFFWRLNSLSLMVSFSAELQLESDWEITLSRIVVYMFKVWMEIGKEAADEEGIAVQHQRGFNNAWRSHIFNKYLGIEYHIHCHEPAAIWIFRRLNTIDIGQHITDHWIPSGWDMGSSSI
ncbi:hypothetical protein EDC04DRAFT_2601991 [Pisolithus marmoratus]|nr:hypothetical protein EDC04DRAFT_2601991 [Pisolithus marmoratus]